MRTNPSVVVVPPFECAWLTEPEFVLEGSRGCITFEVKGDNDATVLLKQRPGSRRWQHLSTVASPAPESNYTIILGSHRNSCLKIERDGALASTVNDVELAQLRPKDFVRCWVNYDAGCISVGLGEPGTNTSHTWQDPSPIPGITYAGLSAWDAHLVYREIRVLPPLDGRPGHGAAAVQASGVEMGPPTLVQRASAQLSRDLSTVDVVSVLRGVDLLSPVVPGLRTATLTFAAERLRGVLDTDEAGLAGLPAGLLAEILACHTLGADEWDAFRVVAAWAAARNAEPGPGASEADLDLLLSHIRFPLMTTEQLQDLQTHALWRHSGMLRELVEEAQQLERALSGSPERRGLGAGLSGSGVLASASDARAPRLPSRREAVLNARFLPRRSPGCTELLLVCPGDKNGVTHWLGTRGGEQPWVNPALAGWVRVLASSPTCRSTRPASCVGPSPPRLNFAAPRSEAGRLASWWMLDLGPWHRLAPVAYTLRHDGSRDPLRCWELQGSRDGRDGWQTLRVHDGDASLRLPGGWAAWPIVGHGASVPFRAFRILVTAPQPGNDNPWHASLAQMEFYGLLHAAAGE